MPSWIEITNPTHGGAGWEFGMCLWSPITNKGRQKSWELMREPRPGDLVFHFLKQRHGSGYYFVGASRVAAAAQVIAAEPPEPDRWANMAPYYRVPLEQFTKLHKPVSVDTLLKENEGVFVEELRARPRGQFFERKASGRLQVSLKYLAGAEGPVEAALLQILEREKSTPLSLEGETFVPSTSAPAYPDYTPPGQTETLVLRKIRDTQLSRSVKERFGNVCAVCAYRITLSSGQPYSEGHHLKPLGAGHLGPDTEDNLLVLCPTHHAEFDYGVIAFHPESMTIVALDPSCPWTNRPPAYPLKHLNLDFVRYHYDVIFRPAKKRYDTGLGTP